MLFICRPLNCMLLWFRWDVLQLYAKINIHSTRHKKGADTLNAQGARSQGEVGVSLRCILAVGLWEVEVLQQFKAWGREPDLRAQSISGFGTDPTCRSG